MILFCFTIFHKVLFKKRTQIGFINGSEYHLDKDTLILLERHLKNTADAAFYIVYVYSFLLYALFISVYRIH